MIENITPKFSKIPIKVIGCGLAGAEIAFILANNGFDVHIFDNNLQRKKESFDCCKKNEPDCKYEFDTTDKESDVQNSWSYYDQYETFLIDNMKYELECLNSPILSIANKYNYTNFGLEYDDEFFKIVRKELESNPKIKLFEGTIDAISETETTIIATGHHTDKALLQDLEKYIGSLHTCFFQPEKIVIDAKSINFESLKCIGTNEYFVNLTEEEYNDVYEKTKNFDDNYEMDKALQEEKQITVESIARRGQYGLRNAVFRPRFSSSDSQISREERPYASLKMIYNKKNNVLILDNFFTALDEDEQKQIICSINALKGCKILRYGKIKRKTYLLTPACLNENLQIKNFPNIFVCGGFVGTAGSFESLLMSNYCAYKVIEKLKGTTGADLLKSKCCIGLILDSLINKSVVNFWLFNLSYDIIDSEDTEMENFNRNVEIQKFLSKSQIEKFKEKFYGKYF